jgi:hypothetical protein
MKKHYYNNKTKKKLLKRVKHEKFVNVIINLCFQTIYFKKSNNDVCPADALFGCGDLVNWQFGFLLYYALHTERFGLSAIVW